MSRYVDGFVIPIQKKNIKAYKKMAALGKKVWMQHGALDYYECIGDEVDMSWGLAFSKLAKLKANETVAFSFIVYKSKAHRNKVNAIVHKDPRMAPENFKTMPFDMKRLSMGGFKALVHA